MNQELSQRALDAKHGFELAFKHGDNNTMNAIVDYLHELGLSGLADRLYKRV